MSSDRCRECVHPSVRVFDPFDSDTSLKISQVAASRKTCQFLKASIRPVTFLEFLPVTLSRPVRDFKRGDQVQVVVWSDQV